MMEDPEVYYDMDDEYDDERMDDPRSKKVVYPPRLMVDFTNLGMNALLRYAQFYHLNVREDYEKEELAAIVARHFDGTLEVEEDESIVSFMQRIRNGEKSVVRHRPPEKERKADKKRKKSNSRKRQRDASVSVASTKDTAGPSGTSATSDKAETKGSTESSKSSSRDHDGDAPARSKPSSSSSSSSNAGPSSSSSSSSTSNSSKSSGNSSSKKSSSKKEKGDNGEDNELYCICNLPSYGNMIACDGKKCRNPSQWYHLECVGFSDGHHPDTWLCPECDPKSFQEFKNKKKKSKVRSKSPGSK